MGRMTRLVVPHYTMLNLFAEMGVADNKPLTAASVVVGGALAVAAGYMIYKRLSVKKRKAGKVSKIILYPIKSGPALHLESAECTETGLKFKEIHDR